MTDGDFGSKGYSPMDELLARFFGVGPPSVGRSGRPEHRIDIGRLLSQDAVNLLGVAGRKASEWGAEFLDSEHVLWAATQQEVTQHLLEAAGADPAALAQAVEDGLQRRD